MLTSWGMMCCIDLNPYKKDFFECKSILQSSSLSSFFWCLRQG